METQTQQNGTRLPALDAPGAATTALALRQPAALMEAYIPRSYEQAIVMATTLGKASKISPEEAFLKMAVGAEYDIPATTALRQIDVIDGPNGTKQVGFRAQLMVALCLRRKDICEYFRFVSADAKQATYVAKRVGDPDPVTVTYTIDQATQAKLVKKDGAYEKDPESQLIARASARLARRLFPDIIGNILTPEELAEVAQSRDVTPLPSTPAAATPSSRPAPAQPIDADLVDNNERRIVAALNAATDKPTVDSIAKEAVQVWPHARPKAVSEAHAAAKKRVAAKPAEPAQPQPAPPATDATPAHDERTGEVREPGSDDA